MASARPPAWVSKRGAGRVMAEFKALSKDIAKGGLPGVTQVEYLEDDVMTWRLQVSSFDDDVAAGRALNKQLSQLARQYGDAHRHVVLEVRFPEDYPTSPFFLRVVRPRMAMYTGHVTAGGSVCIEALTLSGTEGSWQASFCVEGILTTVLCNMLHCETVFVRTAMGGGQAGPLRIDLQRGRAVTQASYTKPRAESTLPHTLARNEYSLSEARGAFSRMLAHHQQSGWTDGRAVAAPATNQVASAPMARVPKPRAVVPTSRARVRPAAGVAAGAKASKREPLQSLQSTSAAATHASTLAGSGAAAALPRKQADAPVLIDLLSDSDSEEGAAAAAAVLPKRRRAAQPAALATARTRPAAAAQQQPSELPVTVVDLVDDSNGAGTRQEQQQKRRRGLLQQQAPLASPACPPPPQSLAERLQAANTKTCLDLVLPPEHWHVTDELLHGKLQLVVLPLPGAGGERQEDKEADVTELILNGASRSHALRALRAAKGDVVAAMCWLLEQSGQGGHDPRALAQLRANGLSVEDAAAALTAAGGDLSTALTHSFQCMDRGGPAAVARRAATGGKAAASTAAGAATASGAGGAEAAAKRQAQAERRQAEMAEARRVLARFAANGGVASKRVLRIERIQNLDLYSQYVRRRARVAKEAGRSGHGVNERCLFHGADKETLVIICQEGFDSRVSNLYGSLGAGNYFAESSSYSDAYSRMGKHASTAAAMPGLLLPLPLLGGLGMPSGQPSYRGGVASGVWAAAHPAAAHRNGAAAGQPQFVPDGVAMLLCDVALGKQGKPHAGMRRPADGCQSSLGGTYHAVYHNDQAYPTHIIHYK
ncbi:Poly [ADP-ribose] polymerase 11 [Chlorella vulgaris]